MSTTTINLQISQPDPLDITKITPFFQTETQGEPGQDPTFRIASQVLQWKYTAQGDGSYTNLIDFNNLQLPIANITDLQSGLNAKAPQSTTDTKAEVDAKIAAAIATLINSSPGALDTLDELAAAMGDDPNFAATIVNSLSGKVSLSGSYANPTWITSLAASKLTGLSFAQVSDAIGNNLLELQNSMKSAGYIQSGLNGIASSNAGFIFTDKVNTTSAFSWSSSNGIASLFAGATYKTPVKFNESGAVTFPEYNTGFAKFNDDGDMSSVSLAIADVTSLQAALDAKAPQSTTDTKTEVDNKIAAAIAALISSAPGALDTFDELAAALGDDPNFAATIVNSLAGKVSLAGSYADPTWITSLAASKVNQTSNCQFVTDTEKTTWNAKQNALTNPVTGTGTNSYLTQWSGTNTISASAIVNSSSALYFPNNKGIYYRNAANTANLNALRWYSDNNLSIGDSNVNIITTASNYVGLGTGAIWSKVTLGGETTLFNNISLNGVVQANDGYVSLIKLDTINRVSIAAAGSDTIFGGKIKTVTPSANGAGNWKLGKLIGADGTGATSFIEVEIEGVLYILTAKVK